MAVASVFFDLLAFLVVEHEKAKKAKATKSNLMDSRFTLVGLKNLHENKDSDKNLSAL
ncbi:MAG: hypothetical protein KDD26_03135 [Winogradskyella sp.]|nr:hypothetical protein [Winogradskyella sp.]